MADPDPLTAAELLVGSVLVARSTAPGAAPLAAHLLALHHAAIAATTKEETDD